MIGWLPTQSLAFLAVFVYATHATQAIAFEWKPGFNLSPSPATFNFNTITKITRTVRHLRNLLEVIGSGLCTVGLPTIETSQNVRNCGV